MQIRKLQRYILTFILVNVILIPVLCADFSFSESQDLEIITYRGLNSESFYMVFGELYNGREKAITNIKLEFNLISSSGNRIIDKVNATSMLKVVPSKRRSPFIGYSSKPKMDRENITNVTLSRIFYDDTEEKPKALVLVYYTYDNGTFTTHILNNSTKALGLPKGKPTNHFIVTVTLYDEAKIVGASSGYLSLKSPGLLWDEDTSSGRLGIPPVEIKFAKPFIEDEVMKADKIIASVESKDFSGQYVLVGCKKENKWTWTTLSEEENPLSTVSGEGNNKFASLATLISLAILGVFVAIILKRRKRK